MKLKLVADVPALHALPEKHVDSDDENTNEQSQDNDDLDDDDGVQSTAVTSPVNPNVVCRVFFSDREHDHDRPTRAGRGIPEEIKKKIEEYEELSK